MELGNKRQLAYISERLLHSLVGTQKKDVLEQRLDCKSWCFLDTLRFPAGVTEISDKLWRHLSILPEL